MRHERSKCRSIAKYAIDVPKVECPQCSRKWVFDCGQAVAIRKFGKCVVCLVDAKDFFTMEDIKGDVLRCDECNRQEEICGTCTLNTVNGLKLVCFECSEIIARLEC